MGEAKQRSDAATLHSIEERARLQEAQKRLGRVRDKFQRPIREGDGILAGMQPLDIVWRVVGQTPATEPQLQGAIWLDVVATTRVAVIPMVPNEHIVLVLPRNEMPKEEPPGGGEAGPKSGDVTPGGLVIP